jgi:hypothetical protein
LADIPDWLTADEDSTHVVSARDELHAPFGVFLLLRELTESARRNLGTDRLIAVWTRLGYHVGRRYHCAGYSKGATSPCSTRTPPAGPVSYSP